MTDSASENEEEDIINYYESHNEGDEGKIPALKLPQKENADDYHDVVLMKPSMSVSKVMLKWCCDRCGRYYADPELFEGEPCIPWKER